MGIVIAFIAGLFVGWMIAAIILRHKKAIGSLRVETSDPDGPYLFLELNDQLEYCDYTKADISKQKSNLLT